jgi:hypothetical protein
LASLKQLHSSEQAEILAYVDSRGKTLSLEFIEGLNESDQKKILRLLEEFTRRGEIRNREKFRFEEKPIYAFKSYQVRILCFFMPNAKKTTIVLTHGFIKKKDDMPPSELKRAKRIYQEISSQFTQEEKR